MEQWSPLSLVTRRDFFAMVNVWSSTVTFNLLLSVSVRNAAITFWSRSSIWHFMHVSLQNFDVDMTFWFSSMSKYTDTVLSPSSFLFSPFSFLKRQRNCGLKILQGKLLQTSWLRSFFSSLERIWSLMTLSLHGESWGNLTRTLLLMVVPSLCVKKQKVNFSFWAESAWK